MMMDDQQHYFMINRVIVQGMIHLMTQYNDSMADL